MRPGEYSRERVIGEDWSAEGPVDRVGAVAHADLANEVCAGVHHPIAVAIRRQCFGAVNLAGGESQDCSGSSDPFAARGSEPEQSRFHDADRPRIVKMRRVSHGKVVRPEGVEAAAREFDSRDDRRGFSTVRLRQRSMDWGQGKTGERERRKVEPFGAQRELRAMPNVASGFQPIAIRDGPQVPDHRTAYRKPSVLPKYTTPLETTGDESTEPSVIMVRIPIIMPSSVRSGYIVRVCIRPVLSV